MTTENFCFYLQNRLIQTSQTGGQWYSDTSPFSIPWFNISAKQPKTTAQSGQSKYSDVVTLDNSMQTGLTHGQTKANRTKPGPSLQLLK